MVSKLLLCVALLLSATPAAARSAKKSRPAPAPAASDEKPPLAAWSALWHTAATVEYSTCPGTEPGHQEAFTLAIKADEKKIVATETPEQSLSRKLVGTPELRGKRWVLELRSADGKNGMDVYLTDDGHGLAGTRVLIRSAGKRVLCSVVYRLEATL